MKKLIRELFLRRIFFRISCVLIVVAFLGQGRLLCLKANVPLCKVSECPKVDEDTFVVSRVNDAGLGPDVKETTYTVEEARMFFERFVKGAAAIGSDELSLFGFELSPNWHAARFSRTDETLSVDIPTVSPGRTVLAWREGDPGYVYVAQKLVIVKRSHDGQQGAYLLTLIPEQSYSHMHNKMDAEIFLNFGYKSGFSGLAIYTLAVDQRIMRVDRYEEGVKVEGYGLFGSPEQNAYARIGMNELLKNFTFVVDVKSAGRATVIIASH
ncbi:MAG: hypothetical protein FWE10_08570 [Rikenellaceae bacterium]|nr:hypothetical protein [Rikenellaceae bacterium]MCL2692787.1 hypothetical protein [Rikenellaceae bacterium]